MLAALPGELARLILLAMQRQILRLLAQGFLIHLLTYPRRLGLLVIALLG